MEDTLRQGEVTELRNRDNRNSGEPMVSVCCTTYQHVNFIRDAIEGFISQRTNFPIEIIIRDDASTDGTAQIVAEYAERYPAIIRPILNTENMFRKLGMSPMLDCMSFAQGKYIALCEGDDYWTDPAKLQKQVDFLEANPEYVLTGGYAKQIFQSENFQVVHDKPRYNSSFDFDTGFLFCENPLSTLTACFRNNVIKEFPDIYLYGAGGDRRLYMLLSQHGKCRYVHEALGVYRIHKGGITNEFKGGWKARVKGMEKILDRTDKWNRYFENKFAVEAESLKQSMYLKLLRIHLSNFSWRKAIYYAGLMKNRGKGFKNSILIYSLTMLNKIGLGKGYEKEAK